MRLRSESPTALHTEMEKSKEISDEVASEGVAMVTNSDTVHEITVATKAVTMETEPPLVSSVATDTNVINAHCVEMINAVVSTVVTVVSTAHPPLVTTSVGTSLVTSASSATPSSTANCLSGCSAILEALNGGEKHIPMETGQTVVNSSTSEPVTTVTTNTSPLLRDTVTSKPFENGTLDVSSDSADKAMVNSQAAEDDDADWYAACSDEEKYNPAKRDAGTWEPEPGTVTDLLEKVVRGDSLHLQWRCPGRRSPTPERKEEDMEAKETEAVVEKQQEKVEEKKFDFDDEFSEEKPLNITPRRTPGGVKTPKTKKRVARLDKIMDDIRRHSKIDDSAKKVSKETKAANSDSPQRPLNKLKLSPKKLDTMS